MSHQRRRGQYIKVWRLTTIEDRRGNKVKQAVPYDPHEVRAWVIPQRGSRAEVAGQQIINVKRLGVDPNLEDVELWSRVELDGKQYDIVTPPAMHYGTRKTRHWTIDIRERP